MNFLKTAIIAISALMVLSSSAFAHHAVNSQFDITKNLPMEGVLTRFELVNPHAYVHFNVKGPDGAWSEWSFETGAPIALKRAGLSAREVLKIGETFKFVYSPSRDGSHTGLMTAFTLPDGRLIAFGAGQNIEAAEAINAK
jgi:Family of unknown function (DUF6152)